MIGGDLVGKLTTDLLRFDVYGEPAGNRYRYHNGDGWCVDYVTLREEVYAGLSSGEKVIVDVAEALDAADATLDHEHRQMVVEAASRLLDRG